MKFNPADNYNGLLIQAKAMHTLINCQEKTIHVLSEFRADAANAIANLESERQMNHLLTIELEKIKNKQGDL